MSGWGDSNSRPLRPERSALTGLRYTPKKNTLRAKVKTFKTKYLIAQTSDLPDLRSGRANLAESIPILSGLHPEKNIKTTTKTFKTKYLIVKTADLPDLRSGRANRAESIPILSGLHPVNEFNNL